MANPIRIANAARKIAEKLIETKYPNAGGYAVDVARGEGRSVGSALQHARYSEKNAMRPANESTMNKVITDRIAANSVKVKESGLAGKEGKLGGQHMGGHAGHDFEEIPPHDVMWRDGGDKYGLGHGK